MIKAYVLLSLFMVSSVIWAQKPFGYLWYNLPKEEPHPPIHHGVPFQQLSYTDKDAVLKFYTMEALHKVRFTHRLEDERRFLALQSFWLREASFHGQLNQKALRYYPEYDFSVTNPSSNLGTQLMERLHRTQSQQVLKHLAKGHGLLFFYRGKNSFDRKEAPIIADFCERHRFTLIPVSVDGVILSELPSSRIDNGEAARLKVHYFPALLLINPKAHTSVPIAFGLTTQDVLTSRLTAIADHALGGSV